jgi:hypothetical protein
MPAQKRDKRQTAASHREEAAARAPTVQRRPLATPDEQPRRQLFVLGAGVDVPFGVPIVSSLMPSLAEFARGNGAEINKALRKKLPHLRFSFDKYAADQGDEFVSRLFSDASDVVPTLRSAIAKLQADPDLQSVGEVIDRLCRMAEQNNLTGAALTGLDDGDSQAEYLLDPNKITLTHGPGAALRNVFELALQRGSSLDDKERDLLELFITATSNIEQLLSLYFLKFAQGTQADQKTYLYIAWMFWAYLRSIAANKSGVVARSLYANLPTLATAGIITFNYTNFFDTITARHVNYFHGRLDRYLQLDDRATVDVPALLGVEQIAAFIEGLRLDVTQDNHLDVPAIVPPISFKPVMSREQLRTWARADELLQRADVVVVVGYSFALADEHFNDLLRKSSPKSRIVIVNPDLDPVTIAACRVLGVEIDSLNQQRHGGVEVLASRRLTLVGAKGEQLEAGLLDRVLR